MAGPGRISYGWWIVGAGFGLEVLIGALLFHAYGAYVVLLREEFGWSRTLFSAAFALARAESAILGPVQGWLTDRFGSRALIRVGMTLFGVGFILLSRVGSPVAFFLTFFLMAVGAGLGGYLPIAVAIVRWFRHRRALALGLSSAGSAVGGLLTPVVVGGLTTFGWRATALLSGLVVLAVGLPAAQLFRPRPEPGSGHPHATPAAAPSPGTGPRAGAACAVDFTVREAVRTRAFWLLSLGHGAALLVVSAVLVHLAVHVTERLGYSLAQAATVVSLLTVAQVVGQAGGGWAGDRLSRRGLVVGCMLAHAGGLLLLAYASRYWMVGAFAILHGLAWGTRGPLMAVIRADYFGSAAFGAISGASSMIATLGMTAGPLVAGILADWSGSYRPGFTLLAGLAFLGSFCFLLARRPPPPGRTGAGGAAGPPVPIAPPGAAAGARYHRGSAGRRAAGPTPTRRDDMTHGSYIGRSVRRVDGGEKVSGLTRFAGDVQLPRQVHARLVLSPHAHARVVRVDGRRAAATAGVLGVFTAADLALPGLDPSTRTRAPLAVDRALFVGHPVAVVVAETPALAEDAAGLVEVDYDALPAALAPADAMRTDAPRVRAAPGASGEEGLAMHGAASGGERLQEAVGPNVVSTQRFHRGDVARGLAEADVVASHRFATPMVHQGYLEPRAVVADVDAVGTLTIWTATQALFFTRSEVSDALGLPEHRVRIVATPLGGGFGGKVVLLEPLAGALALRLRRPVSIVMTRTEEFLATTPAPPAVIELTLGATRDGRLTALQGRAVFDAGAFAGAPLGIALLLMGSYYRVPHLDLRGYEVLTHKPGNGAYRAPGAVQGTFAIESLMDEIARRLGMDPLELRLRNASRPGDPMVTGQPWPPMGLAECLERLRRERDGHRPRAAAGDGRVRRGVGVAVGGWMGGIEPASAACRLDGDGTLTVLVGTVDMSGTNTALAQITAEAFGVPVEDVRVVNGDSETAPYAGVSGGSKITYTVGPAVERAARDARRQLLAIAADRLEAAAEDLEIVDRAVRVRGVPSRAVPLRELARASMQFGARHEPVLGRGASATVARSPAFAAHLAEVEVDTETGQVRVVRHLAVQDVGRAINPAAVEGQIQGGVAQGVGWALLEAMPYDAQGQLLAATLMDYALPQSDHTPPVDTVLVEVPSEHGPFGAKGVGEPPVVGVPAAIANAIADATGRRLTELPMTAEAVFRALRDGAG